MRSILFTLILTCFATLGLQAQASISAIANCNSVTVNLTGDNDNVWKNLLTKKCSDDQGPCCKIVKNWKDENNPPLRFETVYRLYTYNSILVAGPQASPAFTNVAQGEYYVRATFGVPKVCPAGTDYISLYATDASGNNMFVGLEGIETSISTSHFKIGNTTPQNNQFNISNASSWYGTPEVDGFCFGEDVLLFEKSYERSYDRYWISIFENGGLNRWESTYWVNGISQDINLSMLWKKNHPNWVFEEGLTYTVQHVVENSACLNDPWNQKVKNFHILYCANGEADDRTSGVMENAQQLSIVPNPANNYIHIKNLNGSTAGLELQIHDLYGRIILSKSLESSDVDVSDVPTGMYLASVFENGKCLKTEKLVIQK